MARAKNPDREKAKLLWIESNGTRSLKSIASELEIPDVRVRKWKSEGNWNDELNRNVPIDEKERSDLTTERPKSNKGNKNATGQIGNKGNKNASPPLGNNNATTFGFFKKILPDDPETLELLQEIRVMCPIEIAWQAVVVQHLAILRAQKIMFVENKDDMSKELSATRASKIEYRTGSGGGESDSKEYEIQFAWDKHANFMNSQSTAITALGTAINRFKKLASEDDERRKRLEGIEEDLMTAKARRAKAEATIVENEAGKLAGNGEVNELLKSLVLVKQGAGES